MRASINLLQESQRIQSKIGRIGFAVQTVSVIVVIVISVAAFFLVSYGFFLRFRSEQLNDQISTVREEVDGLRSVEAKYLLVQQKLLLSSRTVNTHVLSHQRLIDYYNLLRENVRIEEVGTSENSTDLTVSFVAPDVFILSDSFENILSFSKDRGIISVQSESLTFNDEKGYSVVMKLIFSE